MARQYLRMLAFAILLVPVATMVASERLGHPAIGTDDANIFFVYARHVASGDGFVYNTGGERVEGFTSLLWVLVSAAVFRLAAHPERALLVVSVALTATAAAACAWWLYQAERRRAARVLWPAVFFLLLLSDLRYVTWTTIVLMDNALWSCALTVTVVLVTSAARSRVTRIVLPALVLALTLTRPEALVWVPVIVAVAALVYQETPGARAIVGSSALAFAVAVVALTAFRLIYFGYPLPNTYYAKVSPDMAMNLRAGVEYLFAYVASGPVPLLIGLALCLRAAKLVAAGPAIDPRGGGLTVFATVGLLLPVVTGGDHFGGYRFYQSVYPILLLMLVDEARVLISWSEPITARARLTAITAGVLAVTMFAGLKAYEWRDYPLDSSLLPEFRLAENGRTLGRSLDYVFSDLAVQPRVGAVMAGGLKYAYHGEVVDLMGLNNLRMAHNGGARAGKKNHAAFEARTFYELLPDAVPPFNIVRSGERYEGLTGSPQFVREALRNLHDDPTFRMEYEFVQVGLPEDEDGLMIEAWYRRGFLERLAATASIRTRTASPPE